MSDVADGQAFAATPLVENGDDAPSAKLEGYQRTLAQMFELFLNPEIERRRTPGTLPDNFAIRVAQVLFPPEGENRVLFNEEVRGHGMLRAPRDLLKGAPVLYEDLQHLELFDLADEHLDNGHFTAFSNGEGTWRLFFNFQSGRAKAAEILRLSRQFHAAASAAVDAGHAGPAVENLFTAVELVSKAELILIRDQRADGKTHGAIASAINHWGRTGNVDAAFLELFNLLCRQRPLARYGDEPIGRQCRQRTISRSYPR